MTCIVQKDEMPVSDLLELTRQKKNEALAEGRIGL